MLAMQTQLLERRDIRFGPIDHQAHPAVESKWTHDAEFMRLMDFTPARPLSPAQVKKQYESIPAPRQLPLGRDLLRPAPLRMGGAERERRCAMTDLFRGELVCLTAEEPQALPAAGTRSKWASCARTG